MGPLIIAGALVITAVLSPQMAPQTLREERKPGEAATFVTMRAKSLVLEERAERDPKKKRELQTKAK